STPGDSRTGALSTAPLPTLNETVGVPLNVRPTGRLTLIALPAWSAPVAFSSISMSPITELAEGTEIAGAESALLVVPLFGVTWIVTVAGALVSGRAQFGPGVPPLSGLPR